jgi:acyl carrier protein
MSGSLLRKRRLQDFDMSDTKLLAVFQDVLNLAEAPNRAELKYNEFKGWDSVAHMTLVAAIEETFDIMMETDDILGMSDFEQAIEVLKRHNVYA